MQEIVVLDRDSNNIYQPDLKKLGLSALPVTYLSSDNRLDLGEADRVYYFASMINGFCSYQHQMLLDNPDVAQWIIIIGSGDERLLSIIANGLEDCNVPKHILLAGDMSDEALKAKIDGISVVRCKTCLIYSKRPGVGKKTVKALFNDHYCPKWTFEIREGSEQALWESCGEVQKVLIVGSEPNDFSLCKPDALETSPIFFFNRMDENVQRCADRGALWNELRMYLLARDWELPANYPHFFVGSALYETLSLDSGEGVADSLANQDNFVMWDRFFLPAPRQDYTRESMRKFLAQFCSVRQMSDRITNKD